MTTSLGKKLLRYFDDYVSWRLLRPTLVARYLRFWTRVLLGRERPYIVGVTGSVGKTTTVTMIGAVLSHPEARRRLGEISVTRHNMNDSIGLPLTLFGFDDWLRGTSIEKLGVLLSIPKRVARLALTRDRPRFFVLEYGTPDDGGLRSLVQLAAPDIAVVTTVGPAHLERLRTLQGVADEKSALVRGVKPSGISILGDDHAFVDYLEQVSQAPVVRIGGRGVELAREVAREVGRRLRISGAAIEEALSAVKPPKGRLNRYDLPWGTLIDDSYNANPLSMKLGLDTLAASGGMRKVATLGYMAELGDEVARYHAEIGAYARERADLVVGVGEHARGYRPDLWYRDAEHCAAAIDDFVRAGDAILVKGSASARMAQIAGELRERAENGLREAGVVPIDLPAGGASDPSSA